MQRREFILNCLRAVPPVLLSPAVLAAGRGKSTANGRSVIVVGAGIAGLAAADKLKTAGFAVTVLESQDKIGGRIRTDRSLGIAFDEGASWIHGPKRNPIIGVAAEAGAKTFFTDDESVKIFDSKGKMYADDFLDEQDIVFKKTLKAIRKNGKPTESFQEVFTKLYPKEVNNLFWKYMLSAYLEFDTGGDISNLSSDTFDEDDNFRGDDLIITNGYDKITDFLGQGLDIRLNSPVSEIDYSDEKVKVKAGEQLFEADFVLVCIPLGVLKNNSVKFIPDLPAAKKQALDKIKMGNVNKFLLTWDKVFWENDLQYIGITPEIKGKFNYFVNLKKFLPETAGLMTFAFGNYAGQTETMSDEAVTKEIMANLRAIYGPSVPEPTGMRRTKWGQNINSFGSYSYAAQGSGYKDFEQLAEETEDKLFFAGEHTSADYRGTVHGAYLSGIREADKIINLIKD